MTCIMVSLMQNRAELTSADLSLVNIASATPHADVFQGTSIHVNEGAKILFTYVLKENGVD